MEWGYHADDIPVLFDMFDSDGDGELNLTDFMHCMNEAYANCKSGGHCTAEPQSDKVPIHRALGSLRSLEDNCLLKQISMCSPSSTHKKIAVASGSWVAPLQADSSKLHRIHPPSGMQSTLAILNVS
eukprot:1326657-Amphidinium_carterae.1